MSAKLKVKELREALLNRGLETSGLKPALVARLDEAIAAEEASKSGMAQVQPVPNHSPALRSVAKAKKKLDEAKKQEEKRDCAVDDVSPKEDDKPLKRIKVSQVDNMGIEDLQTGPLPKTTDKDHDNVVYEEDKGEESEAESEKEMVVATKKGRAVLDQYLTPTIQHSFHVLHKGDEIYDAMLNQSNVENNNNKFYVIQALEADTGCKYHVYTRWGRVGVKGQDKLFGPYASADDAISEFEGRFYEKTKNRWSDRSSFVAYPKKYTWLEMDYDEVKDDNEKPKEKGKKKDAAVSSGPPPQSKLDQRVQEFISLICDMNMMKQQMMEIGYDAKKMPLGKLSKSTILKGFEVLKSIAAALENSNREPLETLSSEFYTIIPHDLGFKKMKYFVIDSQQKLKKKLEMVEALGEIELATKLLGTSDEDDDDPVYTHYKHLNCGIEPLESTSEEVDMIKKYLRNTHAETHSSYNLEVLQVFQVVRHGEQDCFQPFKKVDNRMLLWHGSRLSNWTGILSQGLRIAPPEAPTSGYMFGKGVYFADMVSKSANYCYTSTKDPTGILLLCEVALGDMRELLHADYNADKLPRGKLSTKGVGSTAPDPKQSKILSDGVVVPMGKPTKQPVAGASLLYNEYIVYNSAQVRMRYLLQVKFNHKFTGR